MKVERKQQIDDLREQMRGGKGTVIVRSLTADAAKPEKLRLMAEITINPGCSIGYHKHEGETEIFYFTAGEGVADDNGQLIKVSAGDVLITGNAGHAVENTGDIPLVMTAVIVTE